MAIIKWNSKAFEEECSNVAMDRLEAAAKAIAEEAKRILASKLKGNWEEHGPYKSYRRGGKLVSYGTSSGVGAYWTERKKGAMVKSIHVARKWGSDERNVWIVFGNTKTWWARQLEYGRGNWRGGAKPFIRPAMAFARKNVRAIIEGGAIGAKEL